MGFMKPKAPKVEEAPPIEQVDERAIDQNMRERERKRQGVAASMLTGERGLAGQSIVTATQKLLGRG